MIKFQYKRLYLAVQYFTSTVTTYFAIVRVVQYCRHDTRNEAYTVCSALVRSRG